jgi:hypothetical protein
MATLQASLRTLAALPGSPLELVARLNQYACAQNLGGRLGDASQQLHTTIQAAGVMNEVQGK